MNRSTNHNLQQAPAGNNGGPAQQNRAPRRGFPKPVPRSLSNIPGVITIFFQSFGFGVILIYAIEFPPSLSLDSVALGKGTV